MHAVIDSFLLIYAGLFAIVNPVASAPLFLVLTQESTRDERHVLARKVGVNGFLLLLGSLFVGSHVLEFFGITLPAVRVAGGLVVMAFSWKLLNDDMLEHRTGGHTGSSAPVDAFYPLTMPLTVGPGSISVAITLGSQRPKAPAGVEQLGLLAGGAVLGLVAMGVTIYLCYRFAERIVPALGVSGTNVLMRLSAFILLCIGVQIAWNGVNAFIAAQ